MNSIENVRVGEWLKPTGRDNRLRIQRQRGPDLDIYRVRRFESCPSLFSAVIFSFLAPFLFEGFFFLPSFLFWSAAMTEIPEPMMMRPLRVINGRADANYMRMRRNQNLRKAKRNPNEAWMWTLLKMTGYKWRPQAIWGHRIFDFWCSELGIAVEVDGPEHDRAYDDYRDAYNLRRHAIVVLRV